MPRGTRTTDNNLELRFKAFNVQSNQWDQIAGDAANPITVPSDSTVIYTCVKSLLMTKYLNQQTGQVSTQVELFDTVQNLAVNTANLPISLTKLVVNAAPPPQNGSMPFQNGTIGFIDSSTSFAYGWMLRENLSVYVQWNVSPTGPGNLDLQVWWNNSASGQAELIYEDTNAPMSGGLGLQKTDSQMYNDSYQIVASLAGATTIQAQEAFSPNYDPGGNGTVSTIDPA